MRAQELIVACVDVGKHPGWCVQKAGQTHTGGRLTDLVHSLAEELRSGHPVALGFECPMYVPRRANPDSALKGRIGEGNRPWCAHAGAGALVAGLGQVDAVLVALTNACPTLPGTTRWSALASGRAMIMIWEAFVTGQDDCVTNACPEIMPEATEHERDAVVACVEFRRRVDNGDITSDLGAEPSLSLAGLHLIANRLSNDLTLLAEPCIVVKARKPG